MLHVPSIRVNLIFVALLSKVGVKVSFESDKIVMTKNNVFFVGKGYCDQVLFVLNIYKIINESKYFAYIVDSDVIICLYVDDMLIFGICNDIVFKTK